jgi:2-polyprenyl-3-methyl-5-hydroxy-6-metoxy-1,4-benzoquinol methylase
MPEPQQCSFCLGRITERYRNCSDRVGTAPGVYSFFRCALCGSLHIKPRPSAETLTLAYGHGYFTHDSAPPHTPSPSAFLRSVKRALFRPGYDVRFLQGESGKLLDVGCGNGNFLRHAQARGWRAVGVEPDLEAAKIAESHGCSVFRTAIEDFSPGTAYDAVTIWHVLEHLDDARSLLSRLAAALAPDGMIVIATPNPESLVSRIFRSYWYGLDPPRHLHIPTRRGLRIMLKDLGMEATLFTTPQLSHGYLRESLNILRCGRANTGHSKTLRTIALISRPLFAVLDRLNLRWGEENICLARVPGRRPPPA